MRLTPTGGGFAFAALLLVVGFAAYNTSNNLIYLMLSVGLATLPVALAAGYFSVRGLEIAGTSAEDAYAGASFRESLNIRTGSRWLEAFGVTVEGTSPIAVVERGRTELVRAERCFPRRGAYPGAPVTLESSFPLGLFRVTRTVAAPRELTVFPRVLPIDPSVLARDALAGGGSHGRPGGGDEFFRLREYARGDHVHHIHWKTSARVGQLMVRELGRGRDERVTIALQRCVGPRDAESDFELVVTATASLASHLAGLGVSFRFLSDELDLRPGSGRAHLRRVLSYLAIVTPTSRRDPKWAAAVEAGARAGERVVAVSSTPVPAGALGLDPQRVLA